MANNFHRKSPAATPKSAPTRRTRRSLLGSRVSKSCCLLFLSPATNSASFLHTFWLTFSRQLPSATARLLSRRTAASSSSTICAATACRTARRWPGMAVEDVRRGRFSRRGGIGLIREVGGGYDDDDGSSQLLRVCDRSEIANTLLCRAIS
jgi:hypothetical protein